MVEVWLGLQKDHSFKINTSSSLRKHGVGLSYYLHCHGYNNNHMVKVKGWLSSWFLKNRVDSQLVM